MRRIFSIAIVASVLTAWIAADALGRPGRGGGGGGPRPGGAGGGARPGGGNIGGGSGARPNAGGSKSTAPGGNLGGQFNGGFNKNAGSPGNLGGQFGKNQFNGQRPNSQQLQQFLGGDAKSKAGEFKNGEFTRGENAAQGKEQFQAQASQIQSNVQARADDLFTPQWYAEHPNAWQATHPHADAWAVATAASVAAWVNAAAYAGSGDTVVVESGTSEETPKSTEDATATGTTTPTSVPATNDPSEWMTIGVFALAQTGQTEPTTLIQLAVNKQGQLNGSYYDLVSDNGTPVSGQVDTTTQRAAWTVGPNSKNVFATTIETLTSDNGPVTLHLPSGKTQNWNLVRVNKAEK